MQILFLGAAGGELESESYLCPETGDIKIPLLHLTGIRKSFPDPAYRYRKGSLDDKRPEHKKVFSVRLSTGLLLCPEPFRAGERVQLLNQRYKDIKTARKDQARYGRAFLAALSGSSGRR
jgi:hypothetical protein